MDSKQSAKRNFETHSLQNQDDNNVLGSSAEDGTSTKRFKEELDPFRIGSILEKMFSFLDADSIKNARQVNKLWSIEGANMLIAKCYLKIPSILRFNDKSNKGKEMEEFKAFLSHKSSDYSKIPNITIDKVGDKKFWSSLGVLGQQVKSIKLNNFNTAVELFLSLFDILTNLKFLNFKDLGYKPEIIKALISLSDADKVQNPLIISFMTLEPKNEEQLEDIEKFVNCNNIFLTELEFNVHGLIVTVPKLGSRVVSIINRLLIKNQNILKSLCFKEGFDKMEVIKILSPAMSTTEANRNQFIIPFVALEAEHAEQLKYIEAFADCENIMIEKLKFGSFSFANHNPNYKARVLNILRKILTTYQNTIKILSFEDEYCKPEFIKVLTSVMSTADKSQNPLVISRMTLELGNVDHLEDIEKFAYCSNIVIEELEVGMWYDLFCDVPELGIRIYNLMGKLLSTSKNVLKKLTLQNCQLYLSLLNFPQLNALTHLDLAFWSDCETLDCLKPCNFSPSFRFSENLPNLSHVTIHECKEQPPDFFAHLFEQTGTAPFVKSLKYSYIFSDLDLEPLLQTFPNLEEFETSDVACSEKMFQTLWKYGANLKRLQFDIDLDNLAINVADLDSIFTGFTYETVDKIQKEHILDPCILEEPEELRANQSVSNLQGDNSFNLSGLSGCLNTLESIFGEFTPKTVDEMMKNLDPYTLGELRVNPSILNLKDLEHLTIRFSGRLENETVLSDRMLAVAAKYAFCLLPKDPRILINVGDNLSSDKYARRALDEVSKLPNFTIVFDGANGEDLD